MNRMSGPADDTDGSQMELTTEKMQRALALVDGVPQLDMPVVIQRWNTVARLVFVDDARQQYLRARGTDKESLAATYLRVSLQRALESLGGPL